MENNWNIVAGENMRDYTEVERRLEAEQTACKVDPSLLKNDFVRGIVTALLAVEAERKKFNPELDIDDFIAGMKDALQFAMGENKY